MKRRETKSVWEDAGLSPLVRVCARWRSFARGLSRGARRRLTAADALAFVESLYGGKFTAVEGGAFPLDKVYRTAGGGLSVSETRLSVNVHPRFDLRLLNIAGGREQASRRASDAVAPSSLTVQTWNVFKAGAGRALPAFGYVNVHSRFARQPESARPRVRGDVTASPSAETPGLRLASLELLRPFVHSPRQEFVNLLLNTYLPAVVSREASGATHGRAAARGETARRFARAPGMTQRRTTAWAYAEPAPRRGQGDAVEVRREFRSAEVLREHTATRDTLPPMLHVLPPASLLSSLSETSLTLLVGGAGHTTYNLSGRPPALSLQQLRTHAAPSGTREASASVHAPRLVAPAAAHRQTGVRDVLSSLNTFVRHVHSNVADGERAGHATVFTRPVYVALLRRGFEDVPARQRDDSSASAFGLATSHSLPGRWVEFVRPASAVWFRHEAGTRVSSDGTKSIFSTQGTPGAGTFLFVTQLLRRPAGTSTAATPSPTAMTALRLAAAAETERVVRETRAARPEGMALELVRQRREQVLQLPRAGYVYTQPPRARLEERQVVTKASREEIVEVVRKEVRSLSAAAPAMPAPSRAELAGLADEVYSTLVRRLMVEKERLGRF